MTDPQWVLLYLVVGVGVAAWMWHTTHDEAVGMASGLPLRAAAVALLFLWYALIIVFWPLHLCWSAILGVRDRIDRGPR